MTHREYLTVDQVAAELGVSGRRVRQYVHNDCLVCQGEGCYYCEYTGQRLPGAYKRKGRWWIPRSALYFFRRARAYREGWEESQIRMGYKTEADFHTD